MPRTADLVAGLTEDIRAWLTSKTNAYNDRTAATKMWSY